jgi:hypothetical protein
MGHPDFRVNGRIFATLWADDRTAMVAVAPDEQAELLRGHPEVFRPAAGAWGRQGSTLVTLSAATARVVRPALMLAWQAAVDKGPVKGRKKRA